jgi:hypothetical protein
MKQRIPTIDEYMNSSKSHEVYEANDSDLINIDSVKGIKSDADLSSYILSNMEKAFAIFIKDKINISLKNVKADVSGKFIFISHEPIGGKDLGALQYMFDNIRIAIEEGGEMPKIDNAGDFPQFIYCTFKYNYNHTAGGSGESALLIPGSKYNTDVYYDIPNAKFLSDDELQKQK